MEVTKNLSGDPRLGSTMEKGIDGDLILFGFPYDIGARRDYKGVGQEDAPDCTRRFLPKAGPLVNPEYGIDISKLVIRDYGNIWVSKTPTLEQLVDKLRAKVARARKGKGNSFVLGGTKEIVYPCVGGLLEHTGKGKIGLILIHKTLDLNEFYDVDRVHMSCGTRKLLTEDTSGERLKVVYLGVHPEYIHRESKEFYEKNKDRITIIPWREIAGRDVAISEKPDLNTLLTKGGSVFSEVLADLSKECEEIHLSISLEAINSAYCPGVSHQLMMGGFSSEEIFEIILQAGKERKVTSVDVTEYNHKVEDWITGKIVANLFYYYAMGIATRVPQETASK